MTDKSLTYIAHLQEINYQIGTTVHIGETISILELCFFFLNVDLLHLFTSYCDVYFVERIRATMRP